MLMTSLTFPELDWEIGVRTRATLMLFDVTAQHTKGTPVECVNTLQDGVAHEEKWNISGLSSTQEMFSYNVPLMTLQVKTVHKLKNHFL
jgi:hypothetical protein